MLDQVDSGSMDSLSIDQLNCLLSIYPRESEIKLMVNKLQEAGLTSFSSGLEAIAKEQLKCGKIEHLMMKLLAYPTDLKCKAQLMLKIQEYAPRVNDLLARITCWKNVLESLQSQHFLRQIVALALKLGSLLN